MFRFFIRVRNRLRWLTRRLGIANAARLQREGCSELIMRLKGLFSETITVQTRQGRMTIASNDMTIGWSLYVRGHYEYDASLQTIAFLKDEGFIPNDGVNMVDIGANNGVISVGLLNAGVISTAVAIEPEPRNFELLSTNIKQNGLLEKTVCLQKAVGREESTLTMELSHNNLGDHRVRATPTKDAAERHKESRRTTIDVQSLPLPRIMELPEIQNAGMSKASMVWIDVQGYEGYVFAGAKELLASGIPTCTEIWPYTIRRAGMSIEEFNGIVCDIWTDYWVERRGRFVRYPINVFDRFLEELGDGDHYENVIFTTSRIHAS